MKLTLVYNPLDHKLQPTSYSYIYCGMFDAVLRKFKVQHITEDCSADDIDSKVVLFWDVHSSHDIKIDGIEKHRSLKMEYMSDPHQKELTGVYKQFNLPVHKLGPAQRMRRARERGVQVIVSPVRDGFNHYLANLMDGMELAWFPPAPSFVPEYLPIADRRKMVLGNGATWSGDFKCYELRRWAFEQPYIEKREHCILDSETPSGKNFAGMLYEYAGALALSEAYPVPKYYEMPLAGCVTFVQYHPEYEDLGFKDGESCIVVNRDNFRESVCDFLDDPCGYQDIADAGQEVAKHYTADKFAEWLFETARQHIIH